MWRVRAGAEVSWRAADWGRPSSEEHRKDKSPIGRRSIGRTRALLGVADGSRAGGEGR